MRPATEHGVQRQSPTRPPADITDLTLLVKVPGRPHLIRAFTDAEADEAHTYAADTDGTIEPLP